LETTPTQTSPPSPPLPPPPGVEAPTQQPTMEPVDSSVPTDPGPDNEAEPFAAGPVGEAAPKRRSFDPTKLLKSKRNLIIGAVALFVIIMLIAAVVVLGGGGTKGNAAGTGSRPGAPQHVRAKASSFKVVLSWRAPSQRVSGYEIMRDGQNLRFVNYPATRFADDQAVPGHRYSYSIKAFSTGSVWSSTVKVKIRTPNAPPSRARLTGSFTVKLVATRSFGLGAGNSNETTGWVFKPKCASGPCPAVWTDLHVAGMKTLLRRSGANYSGAVSTRFNVVCGNKSLVSRFTLQLRVIKAAVVNGEWRATRVKGTFTERTPAVLGCVKSGIDYTFTGSMVR
jgi:hypothetical protein